jgi:hypothetical protein
MLCTTQKRERIVLKRVASGLAPKWVGDDVFGCKSIRIDHVEPIRTDLYKGHNKTSSVTLVATVLEMESSISNIVKKSIS